MWKIAAIRFFYLYRDVFLSDLLVYIEL